MVFDGEEGNAQKPHTLLLFPPSQQHSKDLHFGEAMGSWLILSRADAYSEKL